MMVARHTSLVPQLLLTLHNPVQLLELQQLGSAELAESRVGVEKLVNLRKLALVAYCDASSFIWVKASAHVEQWVELELVSRLLLLLDLCELGLHLLRLGRLAKQCLCLTEAF